ncbi:HYC_CC_PP family protein [Flavobacterium micromati]
MMKIKKSISFFLAFLLLISNIGLAFNVHYCGDKLASITINPVISNKQLEDCCLKNETKKEDCCKDKVVNFQKKSDNTILKVFATNFPFHFLINEKQNFVFSSLQNYILFQSTSYFCDSNAPPFFKLCNQYIFYA